MRRRTLQPLPRAGGLTRDPAFGRQNALFDQGIWGRLDQVQVLGNGSEGHDGCVNALSWSDDGLTLLSGSDDKRICIWGPDTTSESSSGYSPHPLRLVETIATGHRANIFSAKYLPNTSTPTIVTCAGDREVRVFDVERLPRSENERGRGDLDGRSGPGVQVLRCHHDRTKRIATENSPFLFLTVSEDGTVRQHDLRRPHQCRSECPEPLFHAPRGVDLYSLSVSTVTPHVFAVAGRTDCAFICDRRMPEHQTPSWGAGSKSSGQVHCVRRLGLPEHEWKSVEPTSGGRTIRQDRHITCVKMSPDKADEVICAFARHSTALFSIHDDPTSSSARLSSPPLSSGNTKPKSHSNTTAATDFLRSPSSMPPAALLSIAEAGPSRIADGSSNGVGNSPGKRRNTRSPSPTAEPSRGARRRLEEANGMVDLEENERREVRMEEEEDDETEDQLERLMRGFRGTTTETQATNDSQSGPSRPTQSTPRTSRASRLGQDWDWLDDLDADNEVDDDDIDEDGMDLEEDDMDEDDEVDDEDDDEDDGIGEDDEIGEDDSDDDEEGYEYGASPLSGAGEYGGVEVIHPRRYYKGARNVETVKDCNFLGAMSDKVASGSDDGNFFVWDKATGKLEGIWEGDGDVVNVMEQHPTLPLIAVSGIDNTVKMFGPPSSPLPPARSKNRTSRAEAILQTNMQSPQSFPRRLGHAGIMQLLLNRGMVLGQGEEEGEDAPPGCATQ